MDSIASPHSPEQLALFEQRTPQRPYCTDDLERGLLIRSRRQALTKRYIQANPPTLRFWMLMDVDRPCAALSWDEAGLPEPAWSTMNKVNGHAHLAWGISAPVLTSDAARLEPLRYLAAIESAYRAELEADEGFSGLITKNPAHAAWRTLWGQTMVRDLGELADYVDLPRHLPRRGVRPDRIGLGRNCDLFEWLRQWAYRQIRGWKRASGKGVVIYWQREVYQQALDYTHAEHPTPLDYRECWHTARSVALWVWNRFDLEASDRRFSQKQAARGRRSGEARREATNDLRSQALELLDDGASYADAAAAVGKSRRTVIRWAGEAGVTRTIIR